MCALARDPLGDPGQGLPPAWERYRALLAQSEAGVERSLALVAEAYGQPCPPSPPYQGRLFPDRVERVMTARSERERRLFREAVGRLEAAHPELRPASEPHAEDPDRPRVAVRPEPDPMTPDGTRFTLELDERPLAVAETIGERMTSIVQDLGEIPPEYLTAAGDGGYAPEAQAGPADGREV